MAVIVFLCCALTRQGEVKHVIYRCVTMKRL